MPVNTTIKIRKGTESEWSSSNPVLASGEPGFVTDTNRFKIGDGNTSWNSLNYSAIVPSGFIAGSGISIETGTNGLYLIINSSGLNSEQVDDRVAQLLVEGTGVNLTYNDASGSLTIDNLHSEINVLSQEPQGFVNRLDSNISFNDSTRTFTIQPSGSKYDIYIKGVKVSKTGVETVVIGTGTALNYLHFNTDTGLLDNKTTPFNFDTDVPIAYIHWNADINQSTFFGEERHGIRMDSVTHKWIHNTFGIQYIEGLSINNYILLGNGSLDAHAQISISNGTLYQEDIIIDISDGDNGVEFTQQLDPIAYIPTYYHSGSTGQWVRGSGTPYPVKYNATRAQYNLLSGGTWTIPNVPNNRYFAMWIVATNDINDPILAIVGQREDSSLGSADNNNTWDTINLTNIPASEIKPLYRLIFLTNDTYTNTPKSSLQSILDLRESVSSIVNGVTQNDHGLLFGLGDDDHSQYIHINTARTISANHTFTNGLTISSGLLSAASGNFTSLTVNGTGVSVSGHTHTASQITDFNSAVSGLLPTISNSGDNRVLTSTGSALGINGESNLTFDGNLLNITGSGAFSSNLTLNNQTASTIASFDANKNVSSLSTATYPSLTELSYVKGVTSELQTQLNAKQNSLTNPVTGTGIASHIAYWNSSSGIVADSGQLYWDATNNRLGIGTTSPISSLTVSGTIQLTDTTGNRVQFFRGGGTQYDYSIAKEGNHLAVSTANDGSTFRYTQFGYHSGSTWTPKTVINNYNGKVGIINTTPTYELDVTGSGHFTQNVLIDGDCIIGPLKAYKFNGNAWGYDRIIFRSDVNNKITSDANGNYNWLVAGRNWTLSDVGSVGIGTSSPSGTLHISKNDAVLRIGDAGSNAGTGPRLDLNSKYGATDTSAYLGYSYYNNKTYLQHGRSFVGGLELRTANGTPRLYIQDSNGYIGIGTASPAYNLDVTGSGNFSQNLLVNGTAVSVSGHTHTSSSITDFNSAVSGLLPTIANSGDNRVLTSTGSSVGINAESSLTFDGTNLSSPYFLATNASGDEGGEIQLAKPPNGTLSGGVTIDAYQNRLRFFEQGGGARGFYLDLAEGLGGASTPLRQKSWCSFTPLDNQPPASNFATLDTRNSIAVLDFDHVTEESAVFVGVVPDNAIVSSGISVRILWMATSETTGNCRWGVQFDKLGAEDTDTAVFDTATETTTATSATNGTPVITTLTCTTIDALAAGDFFRIKIYRDASDTTNDTLAADAELIAVEVRGVI